MLSKFLTILRFNIVGVLATALYFALGLSLSGATDYSSLTVHVIASLISIAVSYLGHSYFTFQATGPRYVIRFAIITAVMFLASTALTFILAEVLAIKQFWTVTTVAIAYPICSFLLHNLWTFKKPDNTQL